MGPKTTINTPSIISDRRLQTATHGRRSAAAPIESSNVLPLAHITRATVSVGVAVTCKIIRDLEIAGYGLVSGAFPSDASISVKSGTFREAQLYMVR